ncbi:MAG TPA: hypothetical protein VER55_17025, partial [Ardenticatenaceae bacterium]|nr:hypothetical protein [Ardenticatenaceae bacterium]
MKGERYIRASEVGEYVYCHRAWWLRHVQGMRSANQPALRAGRVAHGRHARGVERAVVARRVAVLLVSFA